MSVVVYANSQLNPKGYLTVVVLRVVAFVVKLGVLAFTLELRLVLGLFRFGHSTFSVILLFSTAVSVLLLGVLLGLVPRVCPGLRVLKEQLVYRG